MGLKVVPGSAQDVGSRNNQQDSLGSCELSSGGIIAVVADGMGGLAHGEAASGTAVQSVLHICHAGTTSAAIPDLLLHAVHAANEAVKQVARDLRKPGDVGTTLVITCVQDSELFWIAVGDSALFLYREGTLTQLNTPHIYANRLTGEEARTHPERESLTSYIGIETLTEVDRNVQPFTLLPGDRLLLMSDGIFKVLSLDEMSAVIRGNAQQISDELVQRTLEKHAAHQDNATVLTLAIADEPVPPVKPGKRAGVSGIAAAIVLAAIAAGAVWNHVRPKPANSGDGLQVLNHQPPNPTEKAATTADPPEGVAAQEVPSSADAAQVAHTATEEQK